MGGKKHSAMTTTHTHTAGTDTRKIEDLHAHARSLHDKIRCLEIEWSQAIEQQLSPINPNLRETPESIRAKINDLNDELTLVILEYLFRQI